ncbi:AAA family ATPase [Polynucleobacter sp. MWH-Aus1W21]|uniref:AAA family ATPase n=1 Tax=Polynucleobacter sp. MWH-Aus1W21 TaxID=1855880 RepID=UPI001BFE6726|nr:AAA family ATPase [Polynucleobacter sp. MWH-Aus1W21]QWD66031.1 AAA family ATPase [Polynucleobacter sp. MWH-Aus1W21]
MFNQDEISPKTPDDFIYSNEESRLRIKDVVTGAQPLPYAGKSGVLLYGIYGTGKTTLANMLPNAIEKGTTGHVQALPESYIGCRQGLNGVQVSQTIDKILSTQSLNASGKHYIILDEVDVLTKQAQESLKSSLNTTRGVFVLTTNSVSKLDKGLLDRCVLVEMNAADPEAYLPIAHKVVAAHDVVLNDEELIPTIKGANGSLRNVINNVARQARRAKSNQAAN